jgi:flagellar basal body-associated protein FliL
MSEAAEKPAPTPAAGSGNKKLLLMVLIFNVMIAAGLGYLVISGRNKPVEKTKHEDGAAEKGAGDAEPEEAEPEAKGGKPASKFGPLLDVGTFVANLAATGPAPGRYAKVSLTVEATNEEAKTKVEGALVPIRAEALMYFSNAKPEDVIGQEKIHALADELVKRFNALVGKNTVKRVFFSELVVQ